ncbi:MAG: chloride channel protein [Caldilinea sp.]
MTEHAEPSRSVAANNTRNQLRLYLANIIERFTVPEEIVIVVTALIVGVGTGLGAMIFIWLLQQIGAFTALVVDNVGLIVGTLAVMATAGALVGLLIDRWASEAKGHGVPEVMEAIAIRGGRIRPRVAAVKVLASSLTIGTGGSAGREGPIVQVGSALGSTLGQILGFSEERVRTLVACGAAAGIAATFNAPIAGTIFAMEVILGRFTVRYFGAVVISAVAASVTSQALLGNKLAIQVPAYPLHSLAELPIYIMLGLVSALVAVLFIRVLYFTEEKFDKWRIPLPAKTALGMTLTGILALLIPGQEVLGPGLHTIAETIAQDFPLSLGFMAVLLVGKLLATSFTLGSGNSGGVFAPSLFMGAVLGGMVGKIAQGFWPEVVVNPGAYAIVGMAAVFAGAARAPITAILIVFEMSGDYKLILPLMLATVLSTLVAERIFPESIYTFKLKLKGISLERGRDVDILQSVTVDEVMTRSVQTVPETMTLVDLSDLFAQSHRHGFPMLDEDGRLSGIVTITDLDRAVENGLPRRTQAREIGTPRSRLLVATPVQPVGEVLRRMGTRGLGRMPVVETDAPERLIGMIRRSDIIRAYDIAISRRAELQHRTRRMQLRNLDDTEFVDIVLESGDAAVNQRLLDIAPLIPNECILVSIRRNGHVVIPHGDTSFRPGDTVTAFVKRSDIERIQNCLRSGATST